MTSADCEGVLKAALLWARNHIDVGVPPDLKDRVVSRIDALLDTAGEPTTYDTLRFRRMFPEVVERRVKRDSVR